MIKRAMMATIAMGLTIYSFSFAEEMPRAKILEITGQAQIKSVGDSEWRSAIKDIQLSEGDQIFVGPDSECKLEIGSEQKSVAKIKADSKVRLQSIGNEVKIELMSGELFSLVKKMDRSKMDLANVKSAFQVVSPTAVAAVRGTCFSVAVEGIGAETDTTCQVYESTVALSPIDKPEQELLVTEGKGAILGADGQIEKQFDLPIDAMNAGQEFMQEVGHLIGEDMPKEESPTGSNVADKPQEKDDQKAPGGPTPPGPSDGPTDGSADTEAGEGGVMRREAVGFGEPDSADGDQPKNFGAYQTMMENNGATAEDMDAAKRAFESGNPPDLSAMSPEFQQAMERMMEHGSRVDGAMDGLVMGMAHDSEHARSQMFTTAVLNNIAGNMSDLNYHMPEFDPNNPSTAFGGPMPVNDPAFAGPMPPMGPINPDVFQNVIRGAIEKSDYFQSQPVEIQQQMLDRLDSHLDNYFQVPQHEEGMNPRPEGPDGQPMMNPNFAPAGFSPAEGPATMTDGSAPPIDNEPGAPTGTMGGFTDGAGTYGGDTSNGFVDPNLYTNTPSTIMDPYTNYIAPIQEFIPPPINPNELPSYNTNISPEMNQNIFNFFDRMRADYLAYVAIPGHNPLQGGDDSGYFGAQRVIQGFNYVENGNSRLGSIVFTPIDGAPGMPGNLHNHGATGGVALHAVNVVVKDDPTGVSGTVVHDPSATAPGGVVEVEIGP